MTRSAGYKIVENMRKRTKFPTQKLWVRRNGRLCRRYSTDDRPEGHWNFSNCPCKELRQPRMSASILDLPDECLVIVFEKLEAHEICNVARVCKRFYHVSRSPTLWKFIDLSFQNFVSLIQASLVDTDCSWTEVITNAKRRMLFASFLSARKAALTDILAHGDFNLFREADMFTYLLNSCNLKNLKSISLRIPHGWDFNLFRRDMGDIQTLQQFLQFLVKNCRNVLKSLRCYVDVSLHTAVLLGSLHNLEYLNLNFPLHDTLQPECMDAVLSSLPNLKYLKITICQHFGDDEYFPGHVLRSESLETLDFGFSKQFLIRDLFLPRLHTINTGYLSNYHHTQRAVCLFDVVKRGCPLIQTLNGYSSLVPGLQNFHLSEAQKRELYFCICSIHAPWRVYV